jgi:hypothetical protein
VIKNNKRLRKNSDYFYFFLSNKEMKFEIIIYKVRMMLRRRRRRKNKLHFSSTREMCIQRHFFRILVGIETIQPSIDRQNTLGTDETTFRKTIIKLSKKNKNKEAIRRRNKRTVSMDSSSLTLLLLKLHPSFS